MLNALRLASTTPRWLMDRLIMMSLEKRMELLKAQLSRQRAYHEAERIQERITRFLLVLQLSASAELLKLK